MASGCAARGMAVLLAAVLAPLAVPTPGSAQEGGASDAEHTVRPNETLWGLAARYLDDPFAWEELYRLNAERISDPDRIYPGQRLRLPTLADVAAGGRTPPGAAADPAPAAGTQGSAERPPAGRDGAGQADPFAGPTVFDEGGASREAVTASLSVQAAEASPLVSASDFHRVSWLGPRRPDPVASVVRVLDGAAVGLELPPTLRVRDRIVLSLNAPNVAVGTRLQAVRAGRALDDDVRVYHPVGLVEIDRVLGDSGRARVSALYGRFEVGAPLVASPDPPDRAAARTVPAPDSMRTRVVAVEREDHLVAGESIVFLELPGSGEIVAGDEFAVYPADAAGSPLGSPEDWVAVVRVVRVTPRGASARVVELRDVGGGPGSAALRIRRPPQ